MDLATFNVIQEPDIWTNILERMVKFSMLETAHSLIKDISEIRLLWVNPVMAPAWNLVLQAPFKQSKENVLLLFVLRASFLTTWVKKSFR